VRRRVQEKERVWLRWNVNHNTRTPWANVLRYCVLGQSGHSWLRSLTGTVKRIRRWRRPDWMWERTCCDGITVLFCCSAR